MKNLKRYLNGNSESIMTLAGKFKQTAMDILEYSGGLDDTDTDIFARDILGNACLLEYIAKYMAEHAEEEGKDAQ